MRKPIMAAACLLVIMGSAAFAQDEQAGGVDACNEELARVEGFFHEKIEGTDPVSETTVERASMMLDDADALCTEGKVEEANKKLAAVSKLLASPDQ